MIPAEIIGPLLVNFRVVGFVFWMVDMRDHCMWLFVGDGCGGGKDVVEDVLED
jgi:hypothetical protein